jgi:hypothetical protein
MSEPLLPVAPLIPSGADIYRTLMQPIEPELLPDVLPTLKEKYKGETPDQAKARSARYTKAFAEYDKQYAVYMSALQAKVHTYKRQAVASVEQKDRQNDTDAMNNLESAISSL